MLKIEIASVPDREKLVAEVWNNSDMIAEINQESDELEVIIFPNNENTLSFSLDSFLEVLKNAKKKLTDSKD